MLNLVTSYISRLSAYCSKQCSTTLFDRISLASLLPMLLLFFVFATAQAWAGVTFTVPGANVQVTGSAPLVATVSSNGAPIVSVQVLDGSTQLASYAGNGSSSITIHAVYSLSAGSHTLTVKGTDTGNVTYSATRTFTVAGNGSVTQSPASDSEGPSPTPWQATCTADSGRVINTMKLYLDFNPTEIASFTGLSSGSVTESQSLNLAGGSHSLTTNCWDNSGQVYQSSIDFAVGTAFPAGPGNAITLNLDNPANGWHDCSGCSGTPGGDALHSDTYPALPPTFPTIDNDSRGFSITANDGPTFQGYLWFTSFNNSAGFGPNGPVAWIFDFYANVNNPLNPDFASEFDGNQNVGAPSGKSWVIGTECNYGANPLSGHPTIWRFDDGNLNGGHGSWNDTYNGGGSLTCPMTAAGHWYHVQMYFTLDASTFTYTLRNLRVKDTTLNSVLEDDSVLFTFKGLIDNHGNSIDTQLDGNNNHSYGVTYDKIVVTRW